MKKILILVSVLTASACTEQKPQTTIAAQEPIYTAALHGWNTWNNPNLLCFTHMPDGLTLRINARQERKWPYYIEQSFITSPKYKVPEKITPHSHAYDGSFIEMDVEFEGMVANIKAGADGDDYLILFTPLGEQERVHALLLQTCYLWNKQGSLLREGQLIRAQDASKTFETVVRATAPSSDLKLPLNTPYLAFESDQTLAFYTGQGERSLEEISEILNAKKKDFEAQKAQYGHLATAYDAMQNVMAWNVFYEANGDRAIASVSRMWNEAWGGYIIFDWDTYFAGVMAAVDNKALAYSNAKAITDAITTEGFVPNAEASWGRKTHDRSQPPVGSLCVRLIYDRYKEKDLLEAVYDKLLSWNRWWPQAREQQGFLSWGSNPTELMITPGEKGNTKHSAMLESGLDNSPLFDEAQFDTTTHLLRLASVDLISLYIADCKELAYLAAELGRKEDVQELLKRGEAYGKKLQELWDEQTGIFRDLDLATGEFSTHLAPTNFYPLLAGVATPEQAQRMVKEHLMNPQEFYGEWMLPSISRRDPAFGDNSYWRGRVWAPMNFLVYLGLRQYNLPEAQRLLADRSVALIEKGWLQGGRVFENYNSVTGEGDDVRNSDPFYSWGGLLGLIGLMEYGYWFEEKKMEKGGK